MSLVKPFSLIGFEVLESIPPTPSFDLASRLHISQPPSLQLMFGWKTGDESSSSHSKGFSQKALQSIPNMLKCHGTSSQQLIRHQIPKIQC